MRRITLYSLLIFLFACERDEKSISETFYKIYDTEVSGFTLKSLPTEDLGVLVLSTRGVLFLRPDDASLFKENFPRLSKYDSFGKFEWEFNDTSNTYFRPRLVAEKDNYFVLFTQTVRNQKGEVVVSNYAPSAPLVEIHIDKKTGKELKKIVYPNDKNLPRQALKNGKFLDFNTSNVTTYSNDLRIEKTNDWGRIGNISYLDENDSLFAFEERVDTTNTSTTNFLTLVSKDLKNVSAVCFSSLDVSLTLLQSVITNVYSFDNKEYIFVFYTISGLQTSMYFTPPISLKEEIESEVLKEPYFQKNYKEWGDILVKNELGFKTPEPQAIIDLRKKYGDKFRYPLSVREIFERAGKVGNSYRVFDLDFNDRETFIKKINSRTLIIRNSGSYQILIYEYLIAKGEYKLIQTLGRNIPYYIQDVSVNKDGDLFIVGNTNIGKELNSLFIIKLPYEDIVR